MKGNLYTIKDKEFDEKFPPTEMEKDTLNSSGQIFTKNRDKEGNLTEFVGTGTIIKNNGEKADILTARHVFEGQINKLEVNGTFHQASSRINKDIEEVDYRGIYDIYKVCIHPKKDLARVVGNLRRSSIKEPIENIKKYKSTILDDVQEKDFEGKMYGYPLGVQDQRTSKGFVNKDGKHDIESLGGMSGAGIFDKDGILRSVHIAAQKPVGQKVIYDSQRFNDHHIEENIYEYNRSIFGDI